MLGFILLHTILFSSSVPHLSSQSFIPPFLFHLIRFMFRSILLIFNLFPPSFILYLSGLTYTYLYSIMCSFPNLTRMFYRVGVDECLGWMSVGLCFERLKVVRVRCLVIILLYIIYTYLYSSLPPFPSLLPTLLPASLIHSILVGTYISLLILQTHLFLLTPSSYLSPPHSFYTCRDLHMFTYILFGSRL